MRPVGKKPEARRPAHQKELLSRIGVGVIAAGVKNGIPDRSFPVGDFYCVLTDVRMKKQTGLIQVYTGDGKGKTTAAVGLACRARGHNLNVCYVSFHKDPKKWGYGEHRILKKIGVAVYGFAQKYFCFDKSINADDIRRECLKGMKFIKKIYGEKKYDLLILDEINISVREGFLKESEVLDLMERKPKNLELVLTGRSATKKIIGRADLASGIKEIKHPYGSGIKGRRGVEY